MNMYIKKLGFILIATLVLASAFSKYQLTRAVGGEGTATINGGANATVDQATSNTFTVILTIGASGITVDAQNPTFTIPTGFTAPNATPAATAGDVNADGKWFAVGGATCPVTMGSSSAGGQVITVDVTTVCTVGPGGTITLTYKGTSASAMAAAPLVIKTADDIGWGTPTAIAAPPTITVTAVDVTAPTVTVTMDDSALNIGDTSLVTFTFSETPVGFTTADVTVANGSIGAIDASNPLIQTATYTPTNGIEDATNIITVGTTWTDAALNIGVGDDSPNYNIDTLAPSVTVTMSDAILTFSETALVTFTFSEAPTGFTTADVTIANGSIGAIDASNPLVQTATYTPTNGITDITNVISVGTAWTDTVLNAGVGDDSPNYTLDTTSSTKSNSSITIFKQVINDSGGTAKNSDFPLFVNGNSVTSGQSIAYPAGIYTVTETSQSGYTRTFTGNCDASGQIGHGGSGTHNDICTIVNDDIGAPVVPPVPPLIDVVKVPSPLALPAGPGLVTYTYTLRNIGTVPVINVTMLGDTCSPIILFSGDTNMDSKLDVNETWVYHCSVTLSETHTNIVTATGWANGINAVDVASATVVVGAPIVPPLIHITKVPNPLTLSAGAGFITYTKKVTNPGTVALSNVSVTDDKCTPIDYISGDTNNNSKLDATETWTYTCQTKLTQTTTNTAIATGTANGLVATDFAIATVIVSAIPRLPNTGLPPRENNMLVFSISMCAVSLIFYAINKKQIG